MSIEAMKQALEALEPWRDTDRSHTEQYAAYHALRTAIEQAEKQEHNFCPRCGKRLGGPDHIHTCTPPAAQPAPVQEPFGYFRAEPFGWTDCAETDEGAIALYEKPPAAQRQPLTDEQINAVTDDQWGIYNEKPIYAAHRAYARAIEAAHGIGGQE